MAFLKANPFGKALSGFKAPTGGAELFAGWRMFPTEKWCSAGFCSVGCGGSCCVGLLCCVGSLSLLC